MMTKTLLAAALVTFVTGSAQAQFNASPYNFNNSIYNFDNSPYNFKNSPYNYNNSQYNFNSSNGIYNENGRAGYAVGRPDGGVNIFDNNGNRFGYVPGAR